MEFFASGDNGRLAKDFVAAWTKSLIFESLARRRQQRGEFIVYEVEARHAFASRTTGIGSVTCAVGGRRLYRRDPLFNLDVVLAF